MGINIKQTNIIKSLAILLVLFGHLGLINNAGAWGVALFLFISGYGLEISYEKKGLNNFVKKKLLKVLLPYSIITMLWIVLDYCFLDKTYSLSSMILSLVGLNTKPNIDGTMWYIPFILSYYLVFYLTNKYVSKKYSLFILFVFSIINTGLAKILYTNDVGAIYYTLIFPTGVLIAKIRDKIKIDNKIKYGCIIISTLILISTYKNHNGFVLSVLNIYSAMIIGILLVTMFSVKLSLMSYVGEISYYIYLVEAVFLWKYNFIFKIIGNRFIEITTYLLFMFILGYLFKISLKGFKRTQLTYIAK